MRPSHHKFTNPLIKLYNEIFRISLTVRDIVEIDELRWATTIWAPFMGTFGPTFTTGVILQISDLILGNASVERQT